MRCSKFNRDNAKLLPKYTLLHPRNDSYHDLILIYPGLVMWDFVIDKSGPGAGFLSENFGFPCQSTFHLLLHNHLLHYHPRLAQ
jgi:hypothetical protein